MTGRVNPVTRIILPRTAQASVAAMALHVLLGWPLTGPYALGLFLTPLLCLYFVFVFVAPWNWGLPIVTHLRTGEKAVVLTFDDGPSQENTPRILETLARHRARAAFFVLGENVRRHPDLVRRIVAEGHQIGIHGDSHEPFVLLSRKRVGEEIARTRAAIQDACPAGELTWLRPPHGFKTLALTRIARRSGCRLAAWSLDSRDYRENESSAIAGTVLAQLRPGAIVLLHDGAPNAPTAAALPAIMTGLAAAGYGCALLP